MDLRQLRALVMLSEERHFTRAAARLHVAQPALSQQIRRLEQELGLPLVERTTRRVRLTEAGEAFVSRIGPALAEIDGGAAEMRERVGLLVGTLTIGITQTPGPLDLPALLARFHAHHPQIGLAVREGLSVVLSEDLRADRLDLAFITDLDVESNRGLDRIPLATDALVLVVGAKHPLAKRKSAAIADLRGEQFVSFPDGATIRETVGRAAGRAGFEPNIAFESNEAGRIQKIVAQGLAIAVLPSSNVDRGEPDTRTVALKEASLTYRISVAWRSARRLSPAARAFREMVTADIAVPN